MLNPILQMLGGNQQNNMLNQIANLRQLANGNPQGLYDQMMKSNPQFKQFVNSNQGKSPEQIAKENGIDLGMLKQLINGH